MTGTYLLVAVALAGSMALAENNKAISLKQAKLIIEHNATDKDTGFQGFVDSEGWQRIEVTGSEGVVLRFESRGKLGSLGLTELFFETVEPENKEVPIKETLAKLPAGKYSIKGQTMESGDSKGETKGTAWLTHTIPEGPALLSPTEGAKVSVDDLVVSWSPVRKSITGDPVTIIALGGKLEPG
jgi:hypothetical protein